MPHNAKKDGMELEKFKQRIIEIFKKKVKGKKSDTSAANQRHDGKEGHWLETQMGIAHNRKTAPDLFGFEMKNQAGSKITFGDWSPDYKIFRDKAVLLSRDSFLRIFGMPNTEKNNRYSWSGRPCPKIDCYNLCGQILKIDSENNIVVFYSFKNDARPNKLRIVPLSMRRERLLLVRWDADAMRKRVEKKFNNRGWFQCRKDKNGIYNEIIFGKPICFETWILGVKKGLVFFDSGMYQGNNRPYSQWRAVNKYWDALIVSKH